LCFILSSGSEERQNKYKLERVIFSAARTAEPNFVAV
jgi:hypothetical protein